MADRTVNLRMVGGLGNQLYQFCYAYYIFQKFEYDLLVVDSSAMENYNECWGDLLDVVLDLDSRFDIKRSRNKILDFRIPRLLGFLPRISAICGFISDRNFSKANMASSRSRLYMDGYFEQVDIRQEYLSFIKPLLKPLLVDVPDNGVAINVRGGEYKRLGLSSVDDRQFYHDAVQEILKLVRNPIFYLVTDDVDYAKSLLADVCDVHKVVAPNPEENFKLLYSMPYKILSQSTFSKWAGYLSEPHSTSIYMKEF